MARTVPLWSATVASTSGRIPRRRTGRAANSADLDDDRRGLLRRETGDRPRLAPVARHVLEQVSDGPQAERRRALPGLGAVELQRRRQPARRGVADRRELQIVAVQLRPIREGDRERAGHRQSLTEIPVGLRSRA